MRLPVLGILLLTALPVVGNAQTSVTTETTTETRRIERPGVTSDPALIRTCLCLEQRYKALQAQADTQNRVRADAEAQALALKTSLDAARPTVNTADAAAVDAFRRQSAELQAANERLAEVIEPSQRRAVDAYNQAVAAYDAQCRGRSYDTPTLTQVRASLSCPAP